MLLFKFFLLSESSFILLTGGDTGRGRTILLLHLFPSIPSPRRKHYQKEANRDSFQLYSNEVREGLCVNVGGILSRSTQTVLDRGTALVDPVMPLPSRTLWKGDNLRSSPLVLSCVSGHELGRGLQSIRAIAFCSAKFSDCKYDETRAQRQIFVGTVQLVRSSSQTARRATP